MKLHRGEIWRVRFDPSVGAEIGKTRPAVIVSRDGVGRLPLKIVVPVTEWYAAYEKLPWLVRLAKSAASGLAKESAADCFQAKSVSPRRFIRKLGSLDWAEMDAIVSGIVLCLRKPPPTE